MLALQHWMNWFDLSCISLKVIRDQLQGLFKWLPFALLLSSTVSKMCWLGEEASLSGRAGCQGMYLRSKTDKI